MLTLRREVGNYDACRAVAEVVGQMEPHAQDATVRWAQRLKTGRREELDVALENMFSRRLKSVIDRNVTTDLLAQAIYATYHLDGKCSICRGAPSAVVLLEEDEKDAHNFSARTACEKCSKTTHHHIRSFAFDEPSQDLKTAASAVAASCRTCRICKAEPTATVCLKYQDEGRYAAVPHCEKCTEAARKALDAWTLRSQGLGA
jgi:hypothetical protein